MTNEIRLSFELFDETWNLGIIAFSLIFLTISLLTGTTLPVDTAWFAAILCAAPVVARASMCARIGHIDAFSFALLALAIAALAASGIFAAASLLFLTRFVSSVVAIDGAHFE